MRLEPMLAVASKGRDIASMAGEFLFDEKLDGIRCLLFWDGTRLELRGRRGLDLSAQFPELHRLSGPELFLDGEIVGADFNSVSARARMGVGVAKRTASSSPCKFYAFDVLNVGLDAPFGKRRALLETVLADRLASYGIGVTELTSDPDVLSRYREQGREGVIAKRVRSVYQPGVRSTSWVKFKNVHRLTAVATGYTASSARLIGALTLVLLDGSRVVPIGSVGSGFTDADMVALKTVLDAGRPVLVEVEALNVSRAGMLRSPVFKGVRVDAGWEAASLTQLEQIPKY